VPKWRNEAAEQGVALVIPHDKPIPALLELITAWVPDLSPKHRTAASSIPAFIPPPLRSIYELAGNWPIPYTEQWRPPRFIAGLFGTQDYLLPLDQLLVKGDRFRFIHENQGVWSCETLINEDDPPVFSDAVAIDYSDEGMREVCPSLSHFLITFCLQELAFGSQNLFCVDSEPKNPGELVKVDLKPLWLDGMYAYKGAKYSFWLCDRDLMIMSTSMATPGDYWLAYNKEEASKLLGTKHEIRRIH
jgi:hypothetical protein